MLLLKLLQQLVKALNSEGTPFQVAAGIALGAALGLTPIGNVHNVVIGLLAMILNLSLAGFTLGWTLFVPVGFLLDPLFDRIGTALLSAPGLQDLWTRLYNTPLMPYTNFNNSVVLGSLVFWAVAFVPLLLCSKWLLVKYRAHVYARLERTRVFRAITASKAYDVWRWFRPGP